jgi:predicted TIM-barrel fold metal-dependent hydrolase
MNVHISGSDQKVVDAKVGIYDCDIHPMLKKSSDILTYLDKRWHPYAKHYMDFLRTPFLGPTPYPKASPALSRRDAWPPAGGPPGSDLQFMQEQHLGPNGIACGILQPLFPNASKQRNVEFAAAMCSAVNEWQRAEWTSKEPRLKASIMVSQEYPEAAVAEIEKWKDCSDFAQILLSPKTDEPLGYRRYWPIFEAASRYEIPVGVHVGGVSGRPSSAAGHSSYYIEEHHSQVQAMQALTANLVLEGVLERFKNLKLVFIESGVAWVPSLAWRLDKMWDKFRDEVEHLKRPPSEYIKEHFWFTTQPADEPERPQYLREVFDWIGWDRILFASDYPHWDYDDPRYAIKLGISPTERQMVFHDNAHQLYQSRL